MTDGLLKMLKVIIGAVAIAQNPEKFAKFFYEQGKANATEDVMRKTKILICRNVKHLK